MTSALATALAELFRDEPRRREMGRNGRAAVQSLFTDSHMAEGMLEVFAKATRDFVPCVGDFKVVTFCEVRQHLWMIRILSEPTVGKRFTP